MITLLPPSEGKTVPAEGLPLDLSRLLHSSLSDLRMGVLDALHRLCIGDTETALNVLGLTEGQRDVLRRNQALFAVPCDSAFRVYTGVLYSQIGFETLTPAHVDRLTECVWITSALFGFIGFADAIPAYRLSGDVRLPGIGALSAYWRPQLTTLLASTAGYVLDMRSGIYVKLAPIDGSFAERTIVPRILQKMPIGPPKLITHFNKATKGRIIRALAMADNPVETLDQFLSVIALMGADVDVTLPTRAGGFIQVDILVSSV